MQKNTLRKFMLNKRSLLSDIEVNKMSLNIFELLKSTKVLSFKNILVYSDFKNEVKTSDIIKYLLVNDRGVFLPKCDITTETFNAVQISDINCITQKNKYGIKEPQYNFSFKQSDAEIECVIIPGIAFDTDGNSIGFGCGYYDKFLKNNSNAFKIGLCYEFQIVDKIEKDRFDIPMDMLITENRIIICNREEDKNNI